jgi:hypothetical protein
MLKNKYVKLPDGSVVTNAVNVEKYFAVISKPEPDPDWYLVVNKTWLWEKAVKLSGYKHLTQTKLTHWIKTWAEARGVIIDPNYKRGASAERYYRVVHFNANFYLDSKVGTTGGQSWNAEDAPF